MTCFLHQYADTDADVTLIFFSRNFSVGRGGGRFCVIGRLIVTKGLRVTSLTCTGTGWWFWLVDCEKIPFGAGDTFIEPVKLTKAMS